MKLRILSLLLVLLPGCATLPPPPDRSLAALEQVLAERDSATAALTEWCGRHAIAEPAGITALPAPSIAGKPPPEPRALLEVGQAEPLGYRHVHLACGDVVLSEAHNWYVRGRLTEGMNQALDTTRTPFGQVVAPLGFQRERLAGERGAAPPCPPGTILSHRALLQLPDGRPISLVVECYTAANLRD